MSFTTEPIFNFGLLEDGIESTFHFEDVGNVPGILNEVGDSGSNEAILFNEAGESVGTSFVEIELVQQLTDGASIAEIENIYDFGEGNTITAAGSLNLEELRALQPAEVEIVNGEGIFDGAEGKVTLTQAELDVLDVIEIDLSLAADESFLSFTEELILASGAEIIDVDGINGISTIGEGFTTFEANWYASDTELSDAEPDTVLATIIGDSTVIAQLGNGDLIAEIEETIQFVDGPFIGDEITTKGLIKPGLDSIGTSTLPIVSGTGNFEDLVGIETVTGFDSSMPNIVDVSLSLLPEIVGTDGDDKLQGQEADESISGNNGNDTLSGGQGNDIIAGGRGDDIIRGGAGNDILAGDRIDHFNDDGTNELKGDNGNDTIYGGGKADLIGGGNGDDLLFGKGGDDLINGGNGFDLLNGGLGDDTLRGQGGIDVADYSDLPFGDLSASIAGVDVNLEQNHVRHSSTNNPLHSTDTLKSIENVIGTSRNDRFIGDNQDNVFYGLSEIGRDDRASEFKALNGDTYHVAGDVVEYDGKLSEFTFDVSGSPFVGLTVTKDDIGTDTLIDVEFLKFDDTLVAIDDFFSVATFEEFVTSIEGELPIPDGYTSELFIGGEDTLVATKESSLTQGEGGDIVTETITFVEDGSQLVLSQELPPQPILPVQLEIVSGTGRFEETIGFLEFTPTSPIAQPGDGISDSSNTIISLNEF